MACRRTNVRSDLACSGACAASGASVMRGPRHIAERSLPSDVVGCSWSEPLADPGVAGQAESDAIVQAALAALPELDLVGRQPVPAPVRRRRDVVVTEPGR